MVRSFSSLLGMFILLTLCAACDSNADGARGGRGSYAETLRGLDVVREGLGRHRLGRLWGRFLGRLGSALFG